MQRERPLRTCIDAVLQGCGSRDSCTGLQRRGVSSTRAFFASMPFNYVIDVPANLIRETWVGAVSLENLFESCKLEWADPAYRKEMSMLSDFRAAKLEVSHEELRGFVDFMGRQEAVQRHAIVVSRQVGFGVARMYTSLSEASSPYWNSLRVFFDFAEAERWVAMTPGEASPIP
jgi:hypothetical protein